MTAPEIRALLLDPSLFTAPYDAALTEGLLAAGVRPTWAVRARRPGDGSELRPEVVDDFFYPRSDGAVWMPAALRALWKGAEHALGLLRTLQLVKHFEVVHFQWTPVPWLDALAVWYLRRWCPVVITAHDTTPYNGQKMPLLQRAGFFWPLRLADRVIVHTDSAREALRRQGIPTFKIAKIAHGPLSLRLSAGELEALESSSCSVDGRYTMVAFGELKPYKGLDWLVEGVLALAPDLRSRLRIIVAGRPRMNLDDLMAKVAAGGLGDCFEFRLARQSELEVARLFRDTDAFVFPYRRIDASGAYFLSKSFGKWTVASRVGVFAEDIQDGSSGRLVPPGDVGALRDALAEAITSRPLPSEDGATLGWHQIGAETRSLYDSLLAGREHNALSGCASPEAP